ncbi:EAL domain-containing protein [Caulobacter sp. SLTY]|uniref:EAL domain-containing protein n=1 Tax=Caulobacter sp. SLTY TaxID=2683262 RepID=UPI001413155F|nr:EAL domain-containing protein [Caulobacter sp. SLTY]NBB15541.1 EAL domain-containing protein [Caulobacter sp. SLTY]
MGCAGCKDGVGFQLPITMAFQPIVDVKTETVFAYEALVRGADGRGAGAVLAEVSEENRYAFDQQCRTTAIELAADLNLAADGANLSINFLPNAVYEPKACIRLTLAAAMRTGFPLNRIIFEFTEDEAVDTNHLLNILRTYRSMGFKTAIDDFGAGFAGLGLLAKFQPDIVKLDMALIRDIDRDRVKRTVVSHTLAMLRDLGIEPVCEGVETVAEHDVLRDLGVDLMQGYLLAKPQTAALPAVDWVRPVADEALRA